MTFLIGIFFILMLSGMALSFAMATSSTLFIALLGDRPLAVIAQQMYTGADSFPLLAIPLFLFGGELMGRAQITDRLIELSNRLVGWVRGGLAQTNILTSMLFAGISGSAVADSVAIGKVLIPAMEREGFRRDDAAAITAASSIIGPIIPPSIPMVVYGSTLGVSIGGLFAAGVLPGVLLGLGLMVCAFVLNCRNLDIRIYPWSLSGFTACLARGILPLMMPVILIGGILGGLFTPTEAGAVACAYALLIGILVLRTLTLRAIGEALVETAKTTSVIMLIVAASNPLSWLLSVYQVPQAVSSFLLGFAATPALALLVIVLILFVAGMFIETTANILILGPILVPAAAQFGVEPFHFAMVMLLTLMIGLITPPVGLCLFSTAAVSGIRFEKIFMRMWPYLLVELLVLTLVVLVPEISLAVPRALGFL